MTEEEIEIKNKKEYEEVQKKLLSEGYKWIDGGDEYYDLFEFSEEEIKKQTEEYIDKIKSKYLLSEEGLGCAEQGFQDGAKWGMEHAIEWHDLRENPNDFPNDDRDVVNERGMIVWCKDGIWYESGVVMKIRTYPIAWCELPKFKE